jgi:tetratricopeptide (TPR) repeat protein
MSLLNDALRKKRTESRFVPKNYKHASVQAAKASSQNKRYWISAWVVGGIMAGALLFWYFYTENKPKAIGATNTSFTVSKIDSINKEPIPINPTASTLAPKENHALRAADTPPITLKSEKANLNETKQPRLDNIKPKMAFPKANATPVKKTQKPSDKKEQTRLTQKKIKPKSRTNQKIQPKPVRRHPPVLQPSALSHLYEKARRYHRQKRYQEAINLYSQILSIDPQHFDTRFNLISAYLQIKEFAKAHFMAVNLYRQQPDNTDILLNLAIASIGIGDAKKGLELLNEAKQRSDAPLYEIYFHQGVANRHLGQIDKALGCYRKAEQIKPDDPHLLFNLALALDQQQRYHEAIEYYQKYVRALNNEDGLIRHRVEQRIYALQADLLHPPTGKEKPK